MISNTVAVVRSYNNQHVAKQVENLCAAGIGRVIVVTDAQKDNGNTAGWLRSAIETYHVELIEMKSGYTWSNALNRALDAIRLMNMNRQVSGLSLYTHVLNVSVEAQFNRDHLMEMSRAFVAHGTSVVGTTFKGIQNGNVVDLGRSYRHPRNTGTMLKLDALTAFCNSFDSWCDDIGGMEDVEFVLRLKAFGNATIKMLDLQVPLVVGKHHHQPTKEAREAVAMKKIVERMWKFRNRIESTLAEFEI